MGDHCAMRFELGLLRILCLALCLLCRPQVALAEDDETCGEEEINWDETDAKKLFHQVSQVSVCARNQALPEVVARVTDAYAERAKSPPCHIVLWNAEAHRTLAQRLSALRLPGPEQRGQARMHWELARDGFEAISKAGDKAAGNKQVLRECVEPARAGLSLYPSVTVGVEPLESEGYVLQWNEEIITDTKPRVTPGYHQLGINPPVGSRLRVFINSVPQRVLRGVLPVEVQYGDKLDILVRFYDGEITSDDDPDNLPEPGMVTGADAHSRGSSAKPILFWSGIGVGVLGATLATVQFIRASDARDASDRSATAWGEAQCGTAAPTIPSELCDTHQQRSLDHHDDQTTRNTWGFVWTGVAVAGFGTAIITSLVMDDGDDELEEGRAAAGLRVGAVALPTYGGLSLSGSF